MEKLRKIEKGTDNNAFNWLLESNRNACESNNNSLMIRKLVERHNKMVAIINKLIIADVSNSVICDDQTHEEWIRCNDGKFCPICGDNLKSKL